MVKVLDKCPTCGSQRKREITDEKALISWSPKNNGIIIESTNGGVLEQQIAKLDSFWVADVFPNLEEYPDGRLHIWEGRVVVAEDGGDAHHCTGNFRELTEEEWTKFKEGLPLF